MTREILRAFPLFLLALRSFLLFLVIVIVSVVITIAKIGIKTIIAIGQMKKVLFLYFSHFLFIFSS